MVNRKNAKLELLKDDEDLTAERRLKKRKKKAS